MNIAVAARSTILVDGSAFTGRRCHPSSSLRRDLDLETGWFGDDAQVHCPGRHFVALLGGRSGRKPAAVPQRPFADRFPVPHWGPREAQRLVQRCYDEMETPQVSRNVT